MEQTGSWHRRNIFCSKQIHSFWPPNNSSRIIGRGQDPSIVPTVLLNKEQNHSESQSSESNENSSNDIRHLKRNRNTNSIFFRHQVFACDCASTHHHSAAPAHPLQTLSHKSHLHRYKNTKSDTKPSFTLVTINHKKIGGSIVLICVQLKVRNENGGKLVHETG